MMAERSVTTSGKILRRFFPQATIARIRPERSLPSSPVSALTSAMVETESGLSRFGAYVEDNPFIDGVIVLAAGQIIF